MIPREIISDRDTKFTRNFWRYLFSRLETQLKFSTSYHPHKDRKTEQVNQILEDMLRMYVMNNPTNWGDYLHITEYVYKNGCHTSTNISPFEVFYGRKCRTPVTQDSPLDQLMLGHNLLNDLEQLVTKVQQYLKQLQYRQKKYVNHKRKDKYYQIEKHIYLKVK